MLKNLLDKTFLKFAAVGVVNTLFGAGIMFLFYNVFHFGYWFSSASNYVFGGILSYFLNKFFTFKDNKKTIKQVILFILNLALCYFVSYALAKPFAEFVLSGASVTFKDNVAMVIGMAVYFVLNYLGQRFVVFKKK